TDPEAVRASFTVRLSAPSGAPVTVPYSTIITTGDNATPDVDFTSVPTTNLVFAPGTTQMTASVYIIGDTANEGTETFTVRLGTPINATVADSDGLGTILDNDPLPGVRLSIGDLARTEGDLFQFTVTRSGNTTNPVTFSYATADGTAFAGTDYTGVPSTVVTIAAGQTQATVVVASTQDST